MKMRRRRRRKSIEREWSEQASMCAFHLLKRFEFLRWDNWRGGRWNEEDDILLMMNGNVSNWWIDGVCVWSWGITKTPSQLDLWRVGSLCQNHNQIHRFSPASLLLCSIFKESLLRLIVSGPFSPINANHIRHLLVLLFIGLNAELYYLREGKVNDYALQFVVPVPPHISELHFTWQSLVPTPVSIHPSTPTIRILVLSLSPWYLLLCQIASSVACCCSFFFIDPIFNLVVGERFGSAWHANHQHHSQRKCATKGAR